VATKETKLQIVVDAQNRAQGAFAAIKGDLDSLKKSNEGLTSAMKGVGAAGVVAFGSLALVTKGVVEAGAKYEQTQIAFATMIGSAQKGQETLNKLSQFVARTPFELPQIEDASKRLLAYGTTADELIPTLKVLGDISAGVGMDKLPQLILAFGQVKAATRLTGAELRQFTEAGVPLLDELAKHFHTTAGAVQEMVSDRGVSFDDVRVALTGLTEEGGRFFNLMDKQSASLGGLWSNFKDQVTLASRAIGNELVPYLKPLVEKLIEITQAVAAFAQEHPKLTTVLLIGAVAFAAVLAVLLPIAIALPGLIIMFGALGTVLGAVTAISAPLLLAIGAVVAILAIFVSQGYLTKAAWQEVWLGIKVIVADAANAVIGTVEGMINFIINGVNTAIRAINSVIAAAQKVPGVGKLIPSISELKRADLGRFDVGAIANADLAGRANPVSSGVSTVNLVGGTYLSESVAEQIGDMIMSRLKLSSAL
jgi:tape measure domain-containing protein